MQGNKLVLFFSLLICPLSRQAPAGEPRRVEYKNICACVSMGVYLRVCSTVYNNKRLEIFQVSINKGFHPHTGILCSENINKEEMLHADMERSQGYVIKVGKKIKTWNNVHNLLFFV